MARFNSIGRLTVKENVERRKEEGEEKRKKKEKRRGRRRKRILRTRDQAGGVGDGGGGGSWLIWGGGRRYGINGVVSSKANRVVLELANEALKIKDVAVWDEDALLCIRALVVDEQ
ncbi:hypothetical protein LWI29_016086 [Acer saccharum]|uniref:Uncharacterized protein n=1 Tax=Acer saccharum TaxID=4024 RepID=A0AA39SGC9_ACESA|nr:hypothetical protein LWI29_016086 [Acer saccharum]